MASFVSRQRIWSLTLLADMVPSLENALDIIHILQKNLPSINDGADYSIHSKETNYQSSVIARLITSVIGLMKYSKAVREPASIRISTGIPGNISSSVIRANSSSEIAILAT